MKNMTDIILRRGFKVARAKLEVVRGQGMYMGVVLWYYYLRRSRPESGLICLMTRGWNIHL